MVEGLSPANFTQHLPQQSWVCWPEKRVAGLLLPCLSVPWTGLSVVSITPSAECSGMISVPAAQMRQLVWGIVLCQHKTAQNVKGRDTFPTKAAHAIIKLQRERGSGFCLWLQLHDLCSRQIKHPIKAVSKPNNTQRTVKVQPSCVPVIHISPFNTLPVPTNARGEPYVRHRDLRRPIFGGR